MTPQVIQDLLNQAAIRNETEKMDLDKLKADQILSAIHVIEQQISDVNDLVAKEISLLEDYRSQEVSRVDKKLTWLVFNLEQFMRASGERTIRLPHGTLKLRKGRDRIIIAEMEKFLERAGRRGLLKQVPESFVPDMQAISEYHKKTGGALPDGCQLIPAQIKFTFSTTEKHDGDDDSEEQSTETGVAA